MLTSKLRSSKVGCFPQQYSRTKGFECQHFQQGIFGVCTANCGKKPHKVSNDGNSILQEEALFCLALSFRDKKEAGAARDYWRVAFQENYDAVDQNVPAAIILRSWIDMNDRKE